MELCRTDEGRESVQAAVNRWYITALDMFGRTESRHSKSYIEWGIKRRTNLEARHECIDEVNPILEKLGLEIPNPDEGRKSV
jgi:1,2-phenylacetyl-CoA epoxidase catalytic subunit